MRQAKARGEIDRFPGGRRPKHLPPLSRDPTIRRAQRLLEKAMADKDIVAAGVERPWESMSKAEKLSKAADLALDAARQILELGVDPSDPKLLQIVKDTALSVIAQQVRVDTAVLSVTAGKRAVAEMSDEELADIAAGLNGEGR